MIEESLTKENAKLREAGCKLAEAAMRVIREYDGVHRLSLAVSEWASAIGNEGGRSERFTGDINLTGRLGTRKVYVNVRLADTERRWEWREVEADTLDAAIKVAEQMQDVEVCTEASWIPGGVLT